MQPCARVGASAGASHRVAMGCGASNTATIEAAKTGLANKTMLNAQGQSVDGLSEVNSLTVDSGKVIASDGKIVLSAAKQGRSVTFTDLSTGKVVVRVDLVVMGNFWTGRKTSWDV